MNKRKSVLVFVCALFAGCRYNGFQAQVLDSFHNPVKAIIKYENKKTTIVTDKYGYFILPDSLFCDSMIVIAPGFQSHRETLNEIGIIEVHLK